MINVGLVGCGYWGPNLLRSFCDNPRCRVIGVAELDSQRREYIQQKFPNIPVTADYDDLFKEKTDAIVIATDPLSHYPLAKEALSRHKHVLVEKPLAMNVEEAFDLVSLARRNGRKLMVGHTFEYNAAVRELKRHIDLRTLGQPYYLSSQRLNFGIVRKNVNALWSLAPHDISILIYLLGTVPASVSARGFSFIQEGVEDIVFLTLKFPGHVIAHVHVSWLDPSKVRKISVVGSEKMIVYDDTAANKVQIYDKGIKKQNISDSLGRFEDFGTYQLIKSAGNVILPKIDFKEPLKVECDHFIDCVANGGDVLTDGINGLKVVQVLEAAQASMRSGGEEIKIKEFPRTGSRLSEMNNEKLSVTGGR